MSVERGGNYGWRIREGAHCLDVDAPLTTLASCPPAGENGDPLIDPALEYTHTQIGLAVVGGFVYRGTAIPALSGQYVFADFSREWTSDPPVGRGTLIAAEPAAGGEALAVARARPGRRRNAELHHRHRRGRGWRAVRDGARGARAGGHDRSRAADRSPR